MTTPIRLAEIPDLSSFLRDPSDPYKQKLRDAMARDYERRERVDSARRAERSQTMGGIPNDGDRRLPIAA